MAARTSLSRLATAAGVGYLLGTLPSADVAARIASGGTLDLRTAGSGNPGGANVLKLLGPRWGYAVIGIDIAKGAAAAQAGRAIAGQSGAHIGGASSVIGHCFPVWSNGGRRFRGGKGVGASAGQCLATFPAYFPLDLGVALLTSTRRFKARARAGTLTASVVWVAAGLLWWRRGWPNLWGPKPSAALPIASAVSSAVVAYKFLSAPDPTVSAAAG